MSYSVNNETKVATYNGKEFAPKCVDNVEIALTEEECKEFQAEIDAWVGKEFERAMRDLRQERNQKLSDCDWVVTKSQEDGTEIPSAWKTYRQQLRDLTNGLTTKEHVKEKLKYDEKGVRVNYPQEPKE